MHRLAFALAAGFVLAAPAALGGCFTNGGNTVPDGGTTNPDGGTALPDGAGLPPPGDGGPCIVATSVPASQVPGYSTVDPQVNACSSAQLSMFVSYCFSASATGSACAGFQTDSSNTGCMSCLFPGSHGGPPVNTGGVLLDSTGTVIVGVNTPGCVALADPTSGPACAAALEPLFQCEVAACGSADCRNASADTYQACETSGEKGACMSQYSASQTACVADYSDGGAALTACASPAQVLDRICGSGM
jgi:hypothetical protein